MSSWDLLLQVDPNLFRPPHCQSICSSWSPDWSFRSPMVTAQAEEPDLMLSTSSKILIKYKIFLHFREMNPITLKPLCRPCTCFEIFCNIYFTWKNVADNCKLSPAQSLSCQLPCSRLSLLYHVSVSTAECLAWTGWHNTVPASEGLSFWGHEKPSHLTAIRELCRMVATALWDPRFYQEQTAKCEAGGKFEAWPSFLCLLKYHFHSFCCCFFLWGQGGERDYACHSLAMFMAGLL